MAENVDGEDLGRTEEDLPATGIDRMRADEEVYGHVPDDPAEWAQYSMAEDGLPTVVAPQRMPFAPPLTPERCVCIADTSEFVVRDHWGNVVAAFEPVEVEHAPNGSYRAPLAVLATAVSRAAQNRAGAGDLGWLSVIRAVCARLRFGWVLVEPLRPECRHLATQMTDFQDDDEHVFVARLCSARRSDGEFLTVRDSQMFACKLRSPRDPKSEARIERFDEVKICQGREREREGDQFDVDEALETMGDTGEAAGGIFRRV